MRAACLVLVVVVLGRASPIAAQGQAPAPEPLTLREVVSRALATHPARAQADAVVSRAEASRREQRAALLPSLTTEASLTRFEEPMVVRPLHGFDPRQPPVFDRTLAQANLTLGYTLFDGGARSARLERAAAQVDAALAARESSTEAVIGESVRRYAAVQTARELMAASAASVQALESERARAARLLEQGRVARVALLRADAALSSARAELTSAETELEVAERNLARHTGQERPAIQARTLERVVVSAVAPDQAEAVRQALSANPEVQRLRAQLVATGAGEEEARAQWWPRLLLGGRYVRYGSGDGDVGGEWQSGVQLSYALFTAGARPAAQDRARAETRVAAAELAQAELRAAESVDRAHALLVSARARTTALAAGAEQSAEVARIEKLALDAGAGVQTDYVSAEAALLRARAALTEARFAEVVAWVELARALGVLTPSWIEQNVEPGS
jgi:outer membrane protein